MWGRCAIESPSLSHAHTQKWWCPLELRLWLDLIAQWWSARLARSTLFLFSFPDGALRMWRASGEHGGKWLTWSGYISKALAASGIMEPVSPACRQIGFLLIEIKRNSLQHEDLAGKQLRTCVSVLWIGCAAGNAFVQLRAVALGLHQDYYTDCTASPSLIVFAKQTMLSFVVIFSSNQFTM